MAEDQQNAAPVAPNTPVNVLAAGATLAGVVLWPAFQAPPDKTPAAQVGKTGAVQNHWHCAPGKLNALPAAPAWAVNEVIAPADYPYDKGYPGQPLAGVDVDLFDAKTDVDLDDHDKLHALYQDAQKLAAARVATIRTGADGGFSFARLKAGDYVLGLRGRLAFVAVESMGGEVSTSPPDKHDGVKTAPLAGAHGAHPLAVKATLDAAGKVTLSLLKGGAYPAERLLAPGQKLADAKPETPYRFYALPLVVKSNAAQVDAASQEIGHAFAATAAKAGDAVSAAAVLDLAALAALPDDPGTVDVVAAGDVDALLQRTLLLGGAAGADRTMAFDHAYWCFATQAATQKMRGRFVPLGTDGFFSGDSLYAAADKTKDTYGRFALRFVDGAPLDGSDVRELEVRLVLWGSHQSFVDLSHERFDDVVRDALLRMKRDAQLFRVRVDGKDGSPDDTASVITSIVDADTYAALDTNAPQIGLAEVADTHDVLHAGTPVLTDQGYDRIVLWAAEIVRRRINPRGSINVHSSFRTLAHNRHVYLTERPNHLYWAVAHGAHHPGEEVTPATIDYALPRGTYQGQAGAQRAPDWGNHTTGKALDFDLSRGGSVPQIQWDTNAILLFGASRATHAQNRLWLEQARPQTGGTGTTNWIHMDTGDLPAGVSEYVLTDEALHGPRWDATLIVHGKVTRGGQACLGAKVQLSTGGSVVATAYADKDGNYALRAGGVAAGACSVQATKVTPYAFQAAAAAPAVAGPAVDVTVAWPGDENAADLTIP